MARAKSPSWLRSAQPAPRLLVLPPGAESLDEAHAAIDLWEFYSGKRLDETQRLAVEIMLACRADGSWAARTTGREMPRQNGKGDEIEVVEFWGLVKLDEAILHTVHDAVLLASQAQERMLSLFNHPDLRGLISGGQVWKGTGQQMIRLSTGGQIWYRTRTGGGGRGVDKIDRLVVDEAQHATHEQIAAVSPTLMAAPDPQMNALGTAGLEGRSAWWWGIRKRALTKDPGDFGYIGHTAERVWMDDAGRVHQEYPNVQDRALWRQVNPGTFNGRGQGMAFLEEELWTLGEARFAEEHLCVWAPEPLADGVGVVDLAVWDGLAQGSSSIESDRCWALTVAPDRSWASLGVAGRNASGRLHVEWRPSPEAGTAWVEDRCVEAYNTLKLPLRIRKDAAEASFIEPLRRRGVEIEEIARADEARATGVLLDAIAAGDLVHLGQPSLRKAIEGAELDTSSGGASVFSQRGSAEISPLRAVTVALTGVSVAELVPAVSQIW